MHSPNAGATAGTGHAQRLLGYLAYHTRLGPRAQAESLDSVCPLVGFTCLAVHKPVLSNVSLGHHKAGYFAGVGYSMCETWLDVVRKPPDEAIE